MLLKLKPLLFLCCLSFLFFGCSDEPLEGDFGTAETDTEIDDNINEEDSNNNSNDDEPTETIYATARLDGEPFIAYTFEVENINDIALRLSFFSDLQQQIYIVLPNSINTGVYNVTSAENSDLIYSGAFINSVGNVSESTFNSIENSGTIEILDYNSDSGFLSGKFAFDVATFNNNGVNISDGEFEIILE